MDEPLWTIDDPAAIPEIVEIVNSYPDGWSTPWYGAPGAPVRLEFFREGEHLGSVGVAQKILTRGPVGMLSVPIPDSDSERIYQLIHYVPVAE